MRPTPRSDSWRLRGNAAGALREIEQDTYEPFKVYGRSLAYHTLGREEDADSALALLKAKYAGHPVRIAEVHVWRDEVDQAFEWLERAYVDRDSYAYDIQLNGFFKRQKDDPRYKAFLRKMKFPE